MILHYTENDYGFDYDYDPPSNKEEKIVVDLIKDLMGVDYAEALLIYDTEQYEPNVRAHILDVLKEYFKEDAEAEFREHEAYEKDMENLARESRRW